MSGRPKICQMVPTTFHGISSGSAMMTRQAATRQPSRGIDSATMMPSGTSMARMIAENARLRHNDAKKRCPRSLDGSSNSLNQPAPFQKNWLFPKVSWIE
jgi:hypothetical protein